MEETYKTKYGPQPDGEKNRKCSGLFESHEHAEIICPECGAEFCWSCCLNTNSHEGRKLVPEFMLCPSCGHNVAPL